VEKIYNHSNQIQTAVDTDVPTAVEEIVVSLQFVG